MTKIMSQLNVTDNVTGLHKLGVEKQKDIIFDYDEEDNYTEEEYCEEYPPYDVTGLGSDDMLEGMIDLLDKEND